MSEILGKTRDGIKLSNIVKLAYQVSDIEIRDGTKHSYILNYDGLRPCPVAESTIAKTMLVPWLKKATGYDRTTIYQSMKKGKWRN